MKKLGLILVALICLSAMGQRFIKTVNTINELVALNPNDVNTNVWIAGFTNFNDGGQAIFTYSSSSVVATNTTNVFKPNSFNGRWILQEGLRNVGFTNVYLVDSTIIGGNIVSSNVVATNGTFQGGTFTGTTNINGLFTNGTWLGGTISNAAWFGGSISNANITNSSFTGGTITNSVSYGLTNFNGYLTNAILTNSTAYNLTNIGGLMSGTLLTNVAITNSSFTGGNITNATAYGMTNFGGVLSNVLITNSSFTGGTLTNATSYGLTNVSGYTTNGFLTNSAFNGGVLTNSIGYGFTNISGYTTNGTITNSSFTGGNITNAALWAVTAIGATNDSNGKINAVLTAGGNITLTTNGNAIQIAAGSGVNGTNNIFNGTQWAAAYYTNATNIASTAAPTSTNQFLRGNPSSQPIWDGVNLASFDVRGVLNPTNGGSGNLTQMTPGYVAFYTTNGVLYGTNGFYYNITNGFVGINTNNPSALLDAVAVNGTDHQVITNTGFIASQSGIISYYQGTGAIFPLGRGNTFTTTGGSASIVGTGSSLVFQDNSVGDQIVFQLTSGSATGNMQWNTRGVTRLYIDAATGNIEIGGSAPKAGLDVNVTTVHRGSVTNVTLSPSMLMGTGANTNEVSVNLSGDITTSGGLATTLKNTGTAGTYTKVTFDAQGRETSGATADLGTSDVTGTLAAARFPALTGPVTTTAGSLATSITPSGVVPGTYNTVTVQSDGRVTLGSNPSSPSSGGSSATPATNNLGMWLIADSIGGASGSFVSLWNDSSGNQHNAGSTLSRRPVLVNGAVSAHAAVDFGSISGTNNWMDITNFFTGYTQGELFMVTKLQDDPAVKTTLAGLATIGQPQNSSTPLPTYAGAVDSISQSTNRDYFGSTTVHTIGSAGTALNNWHIFNVRSSASQWIAAFNGTDVFTDAVNTVGWATNGFLGRSDDNTYAGPNHLRGQIAEVLFYSATNSVSSRSNINYYLSQKYGIPVLQVATLPVTAGLVSRWESTSFAGLADGTSVTNWPDLSGYNNTATQSTATNQPVYHTNTFGTNGSLSFNGTNQVLIHSSGAGVSQFSAFVVWNYTSDAGQGFGGPLGYSSSSVPGFSLVSESGSSATYQPHLTVTSSAGTETANLKFPAEGLNESTQQRGKKVEVWTYDGSTALGWLNGTNATISTGGGGYVKSCTIGQAYGYVHADIAAILVYNRALSASEVSAVISYLNVTYPCNSATLSSSATVGTGTSNTMAIYTTPTSVASSGYVTTDETNKALTIQGNLNIATNLTITNLLGVGTAPAAGTRILSGPNGAISGGLSVGVGIADSSTGTGDKFGFLVNQTGSFTGDNYAFVVGSLNNGVNKWGYYNNTPANNQLGSGTTFNQGDTKFTTEGKGLYFKGGNNSRFRSVSLTGGFGAVSDTSVTANSKVFFTLDGTPVGIVGMAPYVSGMTNGVGFGVTAAATDSSSYWALIVDLIP